MPEYHDKHGAPKLWSTLLCLVPRCGVERLIERLARRLISTYSFRHQ